jgi:hypothetical protein
MPIATQGEPNLCRAGGAFDMQIRLAIVFPIVLAATIAGGAAAAVTPPPRWQVPTICKNAKSNEACSQLESSSRGSVLARWSRVPDEDRAACLAKFGQSGKQSYWRLLNCISDRELARMEGQGP